jgi:hypothetical protein
VATGDTMKQKEGLKGNGFIFIWNPQRKVWWRYADVGLRPATFNPMIFDFSTPILPSRRLLIKPFAVRRTHGQSW